MLAVDPVLVVLMGSSDVAENVARALDVAQLRSSVLAVGIVLLAASVRVDHLRLGPMLPLSRQAPSGAATSELGVLRSFSGDGPR